MKQQKWLLYGALAGLAAWLIWWKKPSTPPPSGISVEAYVPPEVFVGGPYSIRTTVTNNGASLVNVTATATADVGGIVLGVTPSSLSFALAPGEAKADYFWFYVPASTEGLVGQAIVNVDGASATTGFLVVPLY